LCFFHFNLERGKRKTGGIFWVCGFFFFFVGGGGGGLLIAAAL